MKIKKLNQEERTQVDRWLEKTSSKVQKENEKKRRKAAERRIKEKNDG